jgi:hypothetical protein
MDMRSRSLLIIAVSLALFAVVTVSGTVSAQEVPKAKTLDELAKMYDVSSCKECHQEIYAQWEKSLHARSILGTPRTSDAFGRMVKSYLIGGQWKYAGVTKLSDLKVEHVEICLQCHLPQIKDATNEVAQELAKAAMDGDQATLQKVSINCLVCHNKKAIIHQWVDGPPERGVIYGNKAGEHEGAKEYKTLKVSPVMNESILCGQCHGLGPLFNTPMPVHCATLYGSHMHAYIPGGGAKTCQECHMGQWGHIMPAYRDPDFAKTAVRMDVEPLSYYFHPKAFDWIPETVVNVKLTSNAGHRMPDG